MQSNFLRSNNMTSQELEAYDVFCHTISEYRDTIDITHISKNVDIRKIFKAVLDNNPQFFFFNKSFMGKETSSAKRLIKLSDFISKSDAIKMQNEITSVVTPLISVAKAKGKAPYEQLISAYQQMQKHILYDTTELEAFSSGKKASNRNTYNIYGALVQRKAVCEGYASAFQYVVQSMGYKCAVVSGTSRHQHYGILPHAWNLIEIGRNFYHVDLTWDSNQYAESRDYSYDWFLVGEEDILLDHEWDLSQTPPATDTSLSYYRRNGLFAESEEQLKSIFNKAAKKPKEPIRVRCSENVFRSKSMGEYMAKLFLDIAVQYHSKIDIQYSWNNQTGSFYAKIE